jgi:hypothetical protein
MLLGSDLGRHAEYPDWGFSWCSSVPPGKYQDNTLNYATTTSFDKPRPLDYKAPVPLAQPWRMWPFVLLFLLLFRARGSGAGWGTMLQDGRSRVRFPMKSLDFSVDLILSVALWPLRRVRLKTSPPSVSRLSRENLGASTFHNPMGLHGPLQG